MKKFLKKIVSALMIMVLFITVFKVDVSASSAKKSFKYEYGVFLSLDRSSKNIKKMKDYKVIVLDAQNGFRSSDIRKLKKQGHVIYSYINVGAVENYRDYYNEYVDITLGVYENWSDERWVDVSQKKWQDFILNKLAVDIKNTGVDGFFVDNVDVYYQYPTKEIYEGVETILKGLKRKGKVIVNGGDTFVSKYISNNGNLKGVLDGVNQESVFSSIIDYDKDEFGKNDPDSEKYFKSYLKTVKKNKKKVYLLEYTKDKKLKKKIQSYCKKKGYGYYISKKLDLS